MNSLLNTARPPVFCPGCSHDTIVHALDIALQNMAISGDKVVIVSDIGCSGLIDVFFHTHALHGLHGRALTYAVGVKMARPELTVVVTMGDGGMGIGGAHVLSACRRNLDITLFVLNNFNFGMTGGQYSSTTPMEAITSSRFLNQLEAPLDICKVTDAAGAPFVMRCSGLEKDLPQHMAEAIAYEGFAVMDIWGICPGRFSRNNRINPGEVRKRIAAMTPFTGRMVHNERQEYGRGYRAIAAQQPPPPAPLTIAVAHTPPQFKRSGIVILGSAGQRAVTAGELLCLAALSGGLRVTQKNDYDITVLRGPSVSEIMLWPDEVGYAGIDSPDVVLVISAEGVQRRRQIFSQMREDGLVIHALGVNIPECQAEQIGIDFKAKGIQQQNWALAALAVMAAGNRGINPAMLDTAMKSRFSAKQYASAREVVDRVLQ
jgi:pyruvate/2-oxoacid:ferredoxin oxidoreductase beta subunit/Pyruvate/2-oxoacid:ferredoxin oxidoreductase gamma subunit